jgi:hypothetical protein
MNIKKYNRGDILPDNAVNEPAEEIVCQYCGGDNGGKDEDLLCRECRETYGHALYSEL